MTANLTVSCRRVHRLQRKIGVGRNQPLALHAMPANSCLSLTSASSLFQGLGTLVSTRPLVPRTALETRDEMVSMVPVRLAQRGMLLEIPTRDASAYNSSSRACPQVWTGADRLHGSHPLFRMFSYPSTYRLQITNGPLDSASNKQIDSVGTLSASPSSASISILTRFPFFFFTFSFNLPPIQSNAQ